MPQPKRITSHEREHIAYQLKAGVKPACIAGELGRDRSVISREIHRNRCPQHGYSAYQAHQQSLQKAGSRRKQGHKLGQNPSLWTLVQQKLKLKWSPQQISRFLTSHYPPGSDMHVSHETIYHFIFLLPRGELKKSLLKCLRQQKTKRGSRKAEAGKGLQIPDMVSIHDRPADIEGRQIPGHWEGDLIMGKNNQSAMGTLVERTTRYTILVPLEWRSSDYICLRFANKLTNLPEWLRKSLTYDQGRELMYHGTISGLSKAKIYFCDPHSPWQRGTNENTNGLLRQYFPKGTDFNSVPDWVFDHVQSEFNDRPRAVLDYRKPIDVFTELVALDS